VDALDRVLDKGIVWARISRKDIGLVGGDTHVVVDAIETPADDHQWSVKSRKSRPPAEANDDDAPSPRGDSA
jgi:hypothetical protein